ncbi:hypothetical protein [Altererythrobacter sp. Root672]|uniref:hypothetical protein n=1 Tax=Altererythrobacter sp. Root672 TaxID=1736584 RepID=UPI0006FAD73E|nr:hypothetical protein [Altererythrobacter sp. Root672]KRA80423.1 hypothetical protein ASD76_14720 [Altererythrobacter sp. Root672]
MLSVWRAATLTLAILIATSAHATEPAPEDTPAAPSSEPAPDPAESENSIIVTGKVAPPTRDEVYQQALDVSRVDTGRLYEEALARITTPICPAVQGLKPELADEIIERIRANAARLNLRLGRARCSTNILVTFVDNGQELLSDLAENHPRMFNLVEKSEQTELLAAEAPVRVWNVVETKWRNGAPLSYWRGKPQRPSVRGSTDLLLPTRNDINFALVVFDREAVVGMTATQLADYATMRGLSHTRPTNGDQPMATILALFEEDVGDGPAELTPFDIGYLRSVYFWRPDMPVPGVGRLQGVRGRERRAREELSEP